MTEAKRITRNKTVPKRDVVTEEGLINGEALSVTEETPISTTGETVTVCSNYPRNIKFMVPDNSGRMNPIVINGNAVSLKGRASGILPVGDYGVTLGVPKEAWEYIKTAYKDAPYIVKGLMFATTASNAKAEVRERVDLRHGYEPADPNAKTGSKPLE
jgi:hypothetical protein